MRTYYRSFWFWLRWVIWLSMILFVAGTAHLSTRQPIGGMIASVVMGLLFLFFVYLIFTIEPFAIRLYSDRFEVCFVLGRQVYYYADITDVSLDAVSFRRSGTVKSVRIEFQSHRPLQLIALNSRHKLYEDLHRSWRAAT